MRELRGRRGGTIVGAALVVLGAIVLIGGGGFLGGLVIAAGFGLLLRHVVLRKP